MPKWLQDLIKILYAIAMCAMKHERPGEGTEKKEEVTNEIIDLIDEPGGIEFHYDFLKPMTKLFLPFLIEFVVQKLNGFDFFKDLSSG